MGPVLSGTLIAGGIFGESLFRSFLAPHVGGRLRTWLLLLTSLYVARIVERVDLIAIHQWVAGAFPRTVFLLYAIGNGSADLLDMRRLPTFRADDP